MGEALESTQNIGANFRDDPVLRYRGDGLLWLRDLTLGSDNQHATVVVVESGDVLSERCRFSHALGDTEDEEPDSWIHGVKFDGRIRGTV